MAHMAWTDCLQSCCHPRAATAAGITNPQFFTEDEFGEGWNQARDSRLIEIRCICSGSLVGVSPSRGVTCKD